MAEKKGSVKQHTRKTKHGTVMVKQHSRMTTAKEAIAKKNEVVKRYDLKKRKANLDKYRQQIEQLPDDETRKELLDFCKDNHCLMYNFMRMVKYERSIGDKK